MHNPGRVLVRRRLDTRPAPGVAMITIPCGSHCGFPHSIKAALSVRAPCEPGIRAGELLAGEPESPAKFVEPFWPKRIE